MTLVPNFSVNVGEPGKGNTKRDEEKLGKRIETDIEKEKRDKTREEEKPDKDPRVRRGQITRIGTQNRNDHLQGQ